MLLRQAMRYYRLWIYVCNVALLVSVAGFACVAGRIMLDPRRALIPATRSWWQPSFLYAYLALLAQGGALQLLGCVGALRLSEKLLGAYWLLLLLLLCGDAIVGVAWAFRFDQICAEVRPELQRRLMEEYSHEADFTSTWDELQREAKCCGVQGPGDYIPVGNRTSFVAPGGGQWWWLKKDVNGEDFVVVVPESCCRTVLRRNNNSSELGNATRCDVHTVGCEEVLLGWLRRSADTLFVLGYCVVAFIKLTFLGILRYEIREMIQKIKMLQTDSADMTMSPHQPPPTALHVNHLRPPDRAPLLQKCNECNPATVMCTPPSITKLPNHLPHSHPHHHHLGLGNGPASLVANDGNDSDTNSHCALIVVDKPGANGNNNELHELQAMSRQTQI